MWPITLSGRLPIVGLVGRYLTNYLIGREPTPNRIAPLTPWPCGPVVSCGIRTPFGILSPCLGQVAHALLTRPPLKHTRFHPKTSANVSPLDLHVLGTPPAFVLSQDQTLPFNPFKSAALAADPHSLESSVSLRFFSALYRFQGSVATFFRGLPQGAYLSYQSSLHLSTPFCKVFCFFAILL